MSRENNENKSLFVENIKKLTSSQTYQEREKTKINNLSEGG